MIQPGRFSPHMNASQTLPYGIFPCLCNQEIVYKGEKYKHQFPLQPANRIQRRTLQNDSPCNRQTAYKGAQYKTNSPYNRQKSYTRSKEQSKSIPLNIGREELLRQSQAAPRTLPGGTNRPSSAEKPECYFGCPLLGRGQSPPTPYHSRAPSSLPLSPKGQRSSCAPMPGISTPDFVQAKRLPRSTAHRAEPGKKKSTRRQCCTHQQIYQDNPFSGGISHTLRNSHRPPQA